MSNFNAAFGASDLIYENHLNVMKTISFTVREIDIVSCVLHNRGEKKIASLLLISPRTISAHVYNIMNKIGCNSKDQIIDFIETSGKLGLVKEYYTHLLIKSYFEKLLVRIGSTINKKIIRCFCDLGDDSEIDKRFYQSIERHFKLLNIEIDTDSNLQKAYDNTVIFQKISKDSYYHDMLSSICNIIKSDELAGLIEEFNNIYNQIINGQNDHVIVVERKNKYGNLAKIFAAIACASMMLGLFTYYYKFYNNKTESNIENVNDKPPIISQLELFLKMMKEEDFNSNNIDKEQSKNNQSIIKKVEHILDYKNTIAVKQYFEKTEMDSKFLLDYLYNLHSLSSYYMYNKHDGRKAREILLYCQDLIWHYLNTRSAVQISFDKMSAEEIFSELNVITDLPQIYARIIYSIGRTYVYQDGVENAKKYFETSKYLSCKLGLFEYYLSDGSGLLTVSKMNIQDAIKNSNNSDDTKNEIYRIIQEYSKLQDDDRLYIADFIPNGSVQRTVIPATDFYNIFTNQTRVIECYRDLLAISNSSKELREIMGNIASILHNGFTSSAQSKIDRNGKGVKYIIDKIQSRRLAALYNVLGDIFVILYQKNENSSILYIPIFEARMIEDHVEKKYSNDINLEIAYSLFDKSRSISRNTDYTKADAYAGIIKVYEARLNDASLTKEAASDLRNQIKEIEDKKSEINESLGRK